jgi:hypothetical protein
MLLESRTRAERPYPPENADERRALVKRIVASSSFAKSNRLSDFVKYVCVLAEKGRFDDIHEQNIGSAVFGRTRDYDPGVDSIVRSHASRLRHRLREYFDQEGRNESLILKIPPGSYIPVFELRAAPHPVLEQQPKDPLADLIEEPIFPPESDSPLGLQATNPSPDEARPSQVFPEAPALDSSLHHTIRRLKFALIAGCGIIALLLALIVFRSQSAARPQADVPASRNPLWKQFLISPTARTVVVSSDSGLAMYEHLTGRAVALASYMSGEYLKNTTSPTVSDDIVRKFGTRRYTPALDLSVLDRSTRLFGERRDHLSFHYSRDLRIEDLKQGNAILLGTSESNPWVQLFEPSMNFFFQDDLLHDTATIVNRHPLPGEALHYDSTPHDPAPTVYGIVAYLPNIPKSGHVLILEGQTMAGTQAAADFVFDDSYLLPFLKKISAPDGSIPNFELLLRSSSFGGQSSRIDPIAYRVEKE